MTAWCTARSMAAAVAMVLAEMRFQRRETFRQENQMEIPHGSWLSANPHPELEAIFSMQLPVRGQSNSAAFFSYLHNPATES